MNLRILSVDMFSSTGKKRFLFEKEVKYFWGPSKALCSQVGQAH